MKKKKIGAAWKILSLFDDVGYEANIHSWHLRYLPMRTKFGFLDGLYIDMRIKLHDSF